MFSGILTGDHIVGLWQDNGILPNNTAKDIGKADVTVYLTDGVVTVTMTVEDDNVLAILPELDFVVEWANEDARRPCAIRKMIQS